MILGIVQLIVYFIILGLLIVPFGTYMYRVYTGKIRFLSVIEGAIYKICSIDANQTMNWKKYSFALLAFNAAGVLFLYIILRIQDLLPLNPENFSGISPDLAFNIAISFITNTNWQSYSGESTLSHFSQMVGLTVQNFLSAATGMAVLMALIRAFIYKNTSNIGSFWVDTVRGIIYILLPLSLLFSVIFLSQGVIQNFGPYKKIETLEKREQIIPTGPVASQISIKQLGSNGGGFFGTNSAHPFENPTPFSNFLQMLAILLIPAALCYSFGIMVGDVRQGIAIFFAMLIIFLPLTIFCIYFEQTGGNALKEVGIPTEVFTQPIKASSGGNMEGKELRHGIITSGFWASLTTATSSGSVNAMLTSFTPMGSFIPLIFMHFSEVIFGGVGSGLYTMIIYIIITVFISGLMVGRTPEYLGKKISSFEIKMASIVMLVPLILTLLGTAIAISVGEGRSSIGNPGAHGFTEVLYAFTSAGNNNGSSFSSLNANTPFYNTILGIVMLFARFWIIIPVLAIAGSIAAKNITPKSQGTLSTCSPLFVIISVFVILLVGVLTFVPSLALGPIAEHLMSSK